MQNKNSSIGRTLFLAAVPVTVILTSMLAVAGEKVLHSFNGENGQFPTASLIFDTAGNLYATTASGGAFNNGMVFELSPGLGGGWTEKALHSFNNNGKDGFIPNSVTFDAAGNLWGTTYTGGTYGRGTVFELSPNAGGGWVERVRHNFGNGTDGSTPEDGLVSDTYGNLYGTTVAGGANGLGAVFELSPRAGGNWVERILYSFTSSSSDGNSPNAGLAIDASGHLYGITFSGGGFSDGGTAFELTPTARGEWTETVLHHFGDGTDGFNPVGTLVLDAAGNLYGSTNWGGAFKNGMVFELSPTAGGIWAETVLHDFTGIDGSAPENAALLFDPAGNLYGTTAGGGDSTNCNQGCGTVFKLTRAGDGSFTESVLHSFNNSDGSTPSAGLILDTHGNLYGTTFTGGLYGDGTVFAIKH